MNNKLNTITLLLMVFALIWTGCSGKDTPIEPGNVTISTSQYSDDQAGGRKLWSYHLIYVNPAGNNNPEVEIIPVRSVTGHWNILNWIEKSPCSDCFKLTNLAPSGNGTLIADVEITHPFTNPNFTGFDVRGIVIFNGSASFPDSGYVFSDSALGDGTLVNYDGYTRLYYGDTAGTGPLGLQGYLKGKYATPTAPDADLNPYKRIITSAPSNTRNAFYADANVIENFEIDMPDGGPFVFGYAVDACWAPPVNNPVVDPMTDFGENANCAEPWWIDAYDSGPGLLDTGGTTKIEIYVYDWQGKESYNDPKIECPDLFNGTYTATYVATTVSAERFSVEIPNDKLAPPGTYNVLISIEDKDNDPLNKPWLDLSAYQVIEIEVLEDTSIALDVTPDGLNFSPYRIALSGDYAYIASRAFGLQIFDISDPTSPAWISSAPASDSASGISVIGPYAALAVGDNGIQLFDVSDPYQPVNVKTVDTPGYADDVLINGDYAYVSDDTEGLTVMDITPLADASVVSTMQTGGAAVMTAIDGNMAYIAIAWEGFVIADISDPLAPVLINTIPVTNTAQGVKFDNGYAYVADYPDKLHVIDVDPPETASIVHTVAVQGGILDLWLDTANKLAYTAAGGWLETVDINSPESANVVGEVWHSGWVTDIEYGNGYAYLANQESGIQIVDVSMPATPVIVSTKYTPGGAIVIDVSGNYAFVANWLGGLEIIDLSIPEKATVLTAIEDIGMVAQDVVVDGGYAYIASRYPGVYIIDIDPVETASIVKLVDTPGIASNVKADSGYVYVADDTEGLQIIDVSTPASASIVKSVPTSDNAKVIDVAGGYAFIGMDSGLEIIDIDPVLDAAFVETVTTSYNAINVTVLDNVAYVCIGAKGLDFVDVSSPGSSTIMNTLDLPGYAYECFIENGIAYVATSYEGIAIADVDPIMEASILDQIPSEFKAGSIKVSGGYIYITGTESGLSGVQILKIK